MIKVIIRIKVGSDPAWPHTDDGIYNLQRKLLKHLDSTGHSETAPRLVAVSAGGCLVEAQAKDYFSSSDIGIGDSHFVLGGSIVEGILMRRSRTEQSLGQNISGLPVIRLFIPERLPPSSEGNGNYFAWEERSPRPWTAIATGASAGDDFNNYFDDEPQSSFFSLGW